MDAAEKEKRLARLREPFRPDQISKLPKPTCTLEEWKKLPRAMCKECGAYHPTTKTIHLDYVGHAALTARLLEVDPDWNWEPLAFDPAGYPLVDKDGGMWIKLTVCGVTRLGYGDSQGKTGANATKERIGDALRNAAMRFGAALDLWHKGESPLFDSPEEEKESAAADKPETQKPNVPKEYATLIDEADNCTNVDLLNEWIESNKERIKKSLPIEYQRKLRSILDAKTAKLIEEAMNG